MHFRGGWMRITANNSSNITLHYDMSWRSQGGPPGTFCSESDVQNANSSFQMDGIFVQLSPNPTTLPNNGMHCVAYHNVINPSDYFRKSWMTGEGSIMLLFSMRNDQVEAIVQYSGGDWFDAVGAGSWSFVHRANLSQRLDTGNKNNSPKPSINPLLFQPASCTSNTIIEIPITDDDRDSIRCRWAKADANFDECGSICHNPNKSAFSLDELSCKLLFNPNAFNINNYADPTYTVEPIALQIEDYAMTLDPTKPMSSVPLQFLIYIDPAGHCNLSISLVSPTWPNEACATVPLGETLLGTIAVKTESPNNEILSITTINPMNSPNCSNCNNPVRQGSATWIADWSWTPTSNDANRINLYCYSATDENGLDTPEWCLSLIVGTDYPQVISVNPNGYVPPSVNNTYEWTITFNKPVRSSKFEQFAKILFNNSGDLACISENLQNAAFQTDKSMTFKTSNCKLYQSQSYYIIVGPAAAEDASPDPSAPCLPNTRPIVDRAMWSFIVQDVSVPIITFSTKQNVSQENITISWSTDKYTVCACNLQSLNITDSFSCSAGITFQIILKELAAGWNALQVRMHKSTNNKNL